MGESHENAQGKNVVAKDSRCGDSRQDDGERNDGLMSVVRGRKCWADCGLEGWGGESGDV